MIEHLQILHMMVTFGICQLCPWLVICYVILIWLVEAVQLLMIALFALRLRKAEFS
jgi:hypothetical protein